jgi:hypothetical protein
MPWQLLEHWQMAGEGTRGTAPAWGGGGAPPGLYGHDLKHCVFGVLALESEPVDPRL